MTTPPTTSTTPIEASAALSPHRAAGSTRQAGHHTTRGYFTAFTALLERAPVDRYMRAAGRQQLRHLAQLNVNAGVATGKFPNPRGPGFLRPQITAPVLTPAHWDTLITALTADTARAQIILTAQPPDTLLDSATTGGIHLLPENAADLDFTCPCRPDADPCAHSTALGYALADRIKTSPGLLFTLRGLPLKQLRTRLRPLVTTTTPASAPAAPQPPPTPEPAPAAVAVKVPAPVGERGGASSPSATTAGTAAVAPAHQAFAAWQTRPRPLPRTASPAALPAAARLPAPPPPAPDAHVLHALAADAAHRAEQLLAGHPGGGHDAVTDAVCLLADAGAVDFPAAAAQLHLDLPTLRAAVYAYQLDGPDAVAVATTPLPADPEQLALAEAAIQPARPAPNTHLERDGNHVTDPAARVQLRLAPTGTWHPYVHGLTGWRPAPGSSRDPLTAYKPALRARR